MRRHFGLLALALTVALAVAVALALTLALAVAVACALVHELHQRPAQGRYECRMLRAP